MKTMLRTLITTAATPFTYTMGLIKPKKKEAPPKEEEKKDDKESSDDGGKDALAAAKEKGDEKNYVTYKEHYIEVDFAERDALYRVRLTTKAIKDADAHISELEKFLRTNREMLEKANNDVYRSLKADIKTNLAYNEKHDAIKKGDLKPEKDDEKQKAEFDQILADGPREYNEFHEKFIRPSTQNALLARANIDMLIPLIRMRGGKAEFQGLEADPIDVHIESERNRAAKQASEELKPPKKPEPETDEWTLEEFFTAAIVVVLIALLLKAFV